MKKTLFALRRTPPAFLFLFGVAACGGPAAPAAPAPDAAAEAAAATITPADMATRIGALAHDSMMGRDTPSPELERAAEYLASEFRRMGAEPAGVDGSYLHRFDYEVVGMLAAETLVRVSGGDYSPRYASDFFLLAGQDPRTEAQAMYAGRAGEVTQLGADARGRIVIFDVPGGELDQAWQQSFGAAIQPAMMAGAAGVIAILDPEFPGLMMAQLAEATAGQQAPVPIVGVTHESGRELLANAGTPLETLRAAGGPTVLDTTLEILSTRTRESHTPPNVVAMLRGSDPALRDTYVVLTAHFDHVGVGAPDETNDSIYNGADDNASGTSALLEIAEAFASLPEPPARSVVFLAVSGEEKGLLGSMAWVEEPTVPLDGIVANINMDMIGRNAPDTVIGIGQEYSTLEGVVQEITSRNPDLRLNVILDPRPEEMFFFRSDQLAFIQQGIPAVFFTTDDHEDYHQPSDEPGKIDNDKAARVARLAFHLAHMIATDPEAPDWTPDGWRRVEQMLRQSPF